MNIHFVAHLKRSPHDAEVYVGYVDGAFRLSVLYRPDLDPELPWLILDRWEFRRINVADESELRSAAEALLAGGGVAA